MRKILCCFALFFISQIYCQCGISDICNANTGIFSNNDAASIAYDNMGSGFHSTFIKETNSVWKIWGEQMQNDGTANALAPIEFNTANYPALTGTIYKMGLGSNSIYNVQLIVLTSTGLFVLGTEGAVLDNSITTSRVFQKITINGKTDGLPTGVTPADVKMLFCTYNTITITTCTGTVFVLSQDATVRGDGETGSATTWSQVMENATTPLTNIIVARGNYRNAFALKSNGTLWTWGTATYLGDGTSTATRNYATQMNLPTGLPSIKMIQTTAPYSYYILGTDKKIYSLGENSFGQLGDRTTTARTSWVNATNPDNSIISDAVWISANEHDGVNSDLAIIKTGGLLYTTGDNSRFMIGRNLSNDINHIALPAGVNSTDIITYAETGGHTCALIKQGSPRYGYVGHRVNGSIGDGSSNDMEILSYDFITPPIVNVCGTSCIAPTVTANTPICPNQNAVFTINGLFGDIVSYKINNGTVQTVNIGVTNNAVITIPNASANQIINLTLLNNATGTCNLALTASATVTISGAMPTFTQVGSYCSGSIIAALPTTSNNGIAGTWSPSLNNLATTTYTFTPTTLFCAIGTTMQIVINQKVTPTFNSFSPICYGSVAPILPIISTNGYTGTWTPSVIDNTNSGSYQFVPNPNQCTNVPPPVSFTVYNDFDFDIIHKCVGNNYTLQIVPIANSFDPNTANFSWTNNSNMPVGNDNFVFDVTNHLASNNISPQFPLIYNTTVLLPNGCFKKHTTDLFSTFCDIQKGISPNNDGNNEFFDLRLLNVKQLKIFNRYGINVYTLDNYFDQWIGQDDAGQELPDGTYYFVIEFNANKPAAVGWIYINREK